MISKSELKKTIDFYIKAIEEKQLANPNLLPEAKYYWRGQWDGMVNIANDFKIKVKKRE